MTAAKFVEDPMGMGKNACKMKIYFVFSSIYDFCRNFVAFYVLLLDPIISWKIDSNKQNFSCFH